ncbi:hypothetical protein QTN47_01130 [Danxiaibacter flavus]|uniref:Uncharacterized protein n=1 Tax=Danxiaibacter flavus TaxID=3049108 RepID=A0ABV3ZCC2_9BACT|nr:hypothetical protein QNM32_01130 [Chitinophagaceae bacterium DXS]
MKVLNRIEDDDKRLLRTASTIELYKHSRVILAAFAILLPGFVFFLGALVMNEYSVAVIALLFSLSGFLLAKWLIDGKAEKLKKQERAQQDEQDVIQFPSSKTGGFAKYQS